MDASVLILVTDPVISFEKYNYTENHNKEVYLVKC